MKKIYLFFLAACALLGVQLSAQSTCGNRDFEDTTFTSWTGHTGLNTNGWNTPISWTPGIVFDTINSPVMNFNSRHTIITANFIDSLCVDPMTMLPDTQMTSLAPGGGSVSVRLGNRQVNYESARLDYSFTVTAANPHFQYQFACVMEDPGHPPEYQPFLMVNMRDQGGNIIALGTDTFYSADPNVPFITSGNNLMIKYRRWTNISVDLSAYIGQTVSVEFINADCAYAGHFGYTYIDVSCFGQAIANVWPGDCDYDLQANNVDVLTLGIAFGATGTVRPGASNSWTAQPSADWTQHIPLGANYKHADCNGDGIVNLGDTAALILNYSQTHPFRIANPLLPRAQSLAPLYLVPFNDTVGPNSILGVDVFAGSTALPVNNFYGLSFDLLYNNALVQAGSVAMDFSGSWLGTKNVSMLALSHDNSSQGRTGIGMCRTTHTEVNGYGYLGTIYLTTGNVTSITPLELDLSGVQAIDGMMVNIPLNAQGATVYIDPSLPQGIHANAETVHFNVYPNPASAQLTVNTPGFTAERIRLINQLGQTVQELRPQGEQTQIDASAAAEGIYLLQVRTEKGVSQQRVVISR